MLVDLMQTDRVYHVCSVADRQPQTARSEITHDAAVFRISEGRASGKDAGAPGVALRCVSALDGAMRKQSPGFPDSTMAGVSSPLRRFGRFEAKPRRASAASGCAGNRVRKVPTLSQKGTT
jgi:hypothetical protein